jgi:hypothetical protein
MFGTQSYSTSYEAEENQARLEYYDSNSKIKQRRNGDSNQDFEYWLASPRESMSDSFCIVDPSGAISNYEASSAYGVAPAFCVK